MQPLKPTNLPAMINRIAVALSLAAVCLSAPGCVRRSLTINTEPQGALIWLNDEEVGRSPVTVDFLWYGDYDVVARLEGHGTLSTHQEITPPWYELPVIAFVTEVLYPGQIHDAREMHFTLTAEVLPDVEELRARAEEFREQALSEAE